jgi:lysyl-tRNA synthetase class 2
LEPIDDLRKQRLHKMSQIEETQGSPYAYEFKRTHMAKEIVEGSGPESKPLNGISMAGRIMAMRRMGKASFAHLMDQSGRIQIYVKQDQVGEESYQIFKLLDIGDIIGVHGDVFQTRTGEITISVNNLSVLSKSLRPLPIVKEKIEDDEKVIYDQFADKELRYRQRYVDLIVNKEVRDTFILRSRIVSHMRRYLEDKGYMEVETPVLQPLYGGAFARPFVTHHNTLDMELYLRIADELYLKRLIVGGFEGVFEIAKDFRNEGMDKDHNPEFTMMEIYIAYKDYHFMMDLTEEMVSTISRQVLGKTRFPYQKHEIEIKAPWKRITYFESIQEATGLDLCQKSDEELLKAAEKLKIDVDEAGGRGKILDEIFSTFVEPKLIQPVFIMDYPLELSPLSKKHRSQPGVAERFEGFIAGKEICNAFSELNDPIDQRQRFEAQARLKASGDEEAMNIDEDYIRAMEYGMPPTGGLGLGIDRLSMLMADAQSIRDVILFPQMRPEST